MCAEASTHMVDSNILVLMSISCFLLAVSIWCFFVTHKGKTSTINVFKSAGLSYEFPIVGAYKIREKQKYPSTVHQYGIML